MKWKERIGTAKTETKRLIPEHCSAVKIFHHLTEPQATNMAKQSGAIAHITLQNSLPVIIFFALILPLSGQLRCVVWLRYVQMCVGLYRDLLTRLPLACSIICVSIIINAMTFQLSWGSNFLKIFQGNFIKRFRIHFFSHVLTVKSSEIYDLILFSNQI